MTLCALASISAVRAAPPAAVIVQATSVDRAAQAVEQIGGRVRMRLPIVNGVSAVVDGRDVAALRARAGVLAVTPDEQVHVAASNTESTSTIKSVFAKEMNADKLWSQGITGAGVRVALIDTGVSAVPDIDQALVPQVPHAELRGQTAACANFSGEQTCDDTYGHGTFVAGLIAGDGSASGGLYKGLAPGAQIVSVKIAGADGSADVTKVLAAIQYVVSFAKELNIRVLNLSLGTNSRVHYQFDPLNFAVQRAWLRGITVVVSAGNLGPAAETISKPGDDPLVITVGAVDDRETPGIDDDRLPRFSARGPTAHKLSKPDVVAPGGKVISLRAPGSYIDTWLRENRPGSGIDATYRRGSGTSMSAALVSGATALLLQARPAWTPNRVKFALTATARKVAERDPYGVGAGLVDAQGALDAPAGEANQGTILLSNASGSLDGSRAQVLVNSTAGCLPGQEGVDKTCAYMNGDETARGGTYEAEQFAKGEWDGSSWYDTQWASNPPLLGSSWYGSSWYDLTWEGSSWYGSSWYGSTDATAYGSPVPGSSWYGAWE